MKRQKRRGRKVGRQKKKPCQQRYVRSGRLNARKRRNVERSSHGQWTYEDLVTHTRSRGQLARCQCSHCITRRNTHG